MEQNENENEKDVKNKEIRLSIINEILKRFDALTYKKFDVENASNFEKKNGNEIEKINEYFKDLKPNEIAYILYLVSISDDKKFDYIINILDTFNSILSHFEYYKKKNPKIKYNNSHFDNYLLKRYECSYIFTTYLSESNLDCRELKIDNKLYFNYIPIKCMLIHNYSYNSTDPKSKQNCGFAHNELELKFHPFVYKKFKCKKNNCKKDYTCPSYHINDDGEPEDMETEVDFDSNEIEELKEVLSSMKLTKNEINSNNKEKKNKPKEKNDFIPTEFNPATYKLYRCPLGSICKLDNKLCLNYHNKKDKRRNPELYQAILCPNIFDANNKFKKDGKCESGDECDKAHNLFEYFYHPNKFRTIKCPVEDLSGDEENHKYCYNRLICPYNHGSDSDCGEDGEKMVLDPELIFNYYKSLMVTYEKSIDSEMSKLKEIKKRYVCYKCGTDNALDHNSFFVDINAQKIICDKCRKKNDESFKDISW